LEHLPLQWCRSSSNLLIRSKPLRIVIPSEATI
jgi:hypothetical protein